MKRPLAVFGVDGVLFPLGPRTGAEIPRPEGHTHARVWGLSVSFHPALAGWLRDVQQHAELAVASSWASGDGLSALREMFDLGPLTCAGGRSGSFAWVSGVAADRPLIWCDHHRAGPVARAWAQQRREQQLPTLLVHPRRDQALTVRQMDRIGRWLSACSGDTPLRAGRA